MIKVYEENEVYYIETKDDLWVYPAVACNPIEVCLLARLESLAKKHGPNVSVTYLDEGQFTLGQLIKRTRLPSE